MIVCSFDPVTSAATEIVSGIRFITEHLSDCAGHGPILSSRAHAAVSRASCLRRHACTGAQACGKKKTRALITANILATMPADLLSSLLRGCAGCPRSVLGTGSQDHEPPRSILATTLIIKILRLSHVPGQRVMTELDMEEENVCAGCGRDGISCMWQHGGEA